MKIMMTDTLQQQQQQQQQGGQCRFAGDLLKISEENLYFYFVIVKLTMSFL